MTTQIEITETKAYNALRIAAANFRDDGRMSSSAQIAYEDAEDCFNRGDFSSAYERALDSLSYSVGVFSDAYKSARCTY